ncbi:MAG: NigD-like protein [Alistipes sp.]|nr:NigD-like protein [Alistipes sp.]
MKKIGLFFALAVACGSVSCTDTTVDQPRQASFVTVHQTASVNGYYFETDAYKTIFPGDVSRIGAYTPTEGQRAIITYNLLEGDIPGYDYNAAIYGIGHIYTSSVRVVSDADELAAFADDPAQFKEGRLLGEWITMIVRCSAFDLSKHKFHMIVNDVVVPENADEEYLSVELRHDDGDDAQGGQLYEIYVSFNTDAVAERLEGLKGIMIRYYDGSVVQYSKIERMALEASEALGL